MPPLENSDNIRLSLTLMGCGKMGSSMLNLWMNNSILSHVKIIDPNPIDEIFANDERITHVKEHDGSAVDTDMLVIAVKPQSLEQATGAIKDHISAECLVLSIAAGKNLASLESIFGKNHPIIRVMPNTPAAIGQGATVAVPNKNVSDKQYHDTASLLGSLGTFHWIENESLMNAVTALSGSGPAYVFYIIELLSKAGEKIGLSREMATDLARQTVIGSAALAHHESIIPASTLRQNVTSPGGTTQAALEVLMDGRIQDIFTQALKAAKTRGEELNS